jgi:hypothetical protein
LARMHASGFSLVRQDMFSVASESKLHSSYDH